MIKIGLGFVLFLNSVTCENQTKLESFVVEGEDSKITDFPYSACLAIIDSSELTFRCGSSILNQKILMTAAHCVFSKTHKKLKVVVKYGHANAEKAKKTIASSFIIHKSFSEKKPINDIALIKVVDSIILSDNAGRIVIMPMKVPDKEVGVIAGWGLVDEIQTIRTQHLKHTHQKIMKREECMRKLGDLPPGVFCGGDINKKNYPSSGDSGSALVVRGFIQVGLLSYKISRSLVVYTDVGYHYKWIVENLHKLYCKI